MITYVIYYVFQSTQAATVTLEQLGIDPTEQVEMDPIGPVTQQSTHTPVTAVLSTQPTVSSTILSIVINELLQSSQSLKTNCNCYHPCTSIIYYLFQSRLMGTVTIPTATVTRQIGIAPILQVTTPRLRLQTACRGAGDHRGAGFRRV